MKDTMEALNARWAAYLEKVFPRLGEMDGEGTLKHYFEALPLLDAGAMNVTVRNHLYELMKDEGTEQSQSRMADSIALIEMSLGFPHKAVALPCSAPIKDEAAKRLAIHRRRYGGDPLPHKEMFNRGYSLRYYFSGNPELVRDKTILHFAPEIEMVEWVRQVQSELNIQYETSDPNMQDVDDFIDMSCMSCADEAYDLIISHRVLEHVYDDVKAVQEVFRALKPGGCFNVSVPIAFEMDETVEWYFPDPLRHGHVRQYGRDFPAMLEAQGFRVEEDRWLFRRSVEDLAENNALRLLVYNAYKP